MNILVCDDHRLLAESLAALLTQRGHRVVDCVETPEAALAAALAGPADVCLLDLNFPTGNGLDIIGGIVSGGVKVVVLTGSSDPDIHTRALSAGASVCVRKTTDIDQLLDIIGGVLDASPVAAGERSGSRRALGVEAGTTRHREEWDGGASLGRFLTDRERDVLEGLVRGESTKALVARLGAREGTVRTHVQSVLNKLGVHSRVAAVSFAVEHSLVKLDRS
jgi:DNA-binding NarL/FixJ family response regulator